MTSFLHIHSMHHVTPVEMVERKGIGHPDTICDGIAEEVSVALSKYYLREFGAILHHNVDKALLIGGSSEPCYNGGNIILPMELIIAGRATTLAGGKEIPVAEIATQAAGQWIKKNLRFVTTENNIRITSKIRRGSNDLVELFQRFGSGEIPLANDTSFGVSYYPYSALEQHVLNIERLLNDRQTKLKYPYIGEDIKVTGVKSMDKTSFTVAIAMVDRFITGIEDYRDKIATVTAFIRNEMKLNHTTIEINTADDYKSGSVYLTVTGTSAESGDDGEVGRGNRINGLITPHRPMTLEAVSGKNPVSHVGKIYNRFAFELSKAIYEAGYAEEAEIFIASQIGKPITRPQVLDIRLTNQMASNKLIEDLAMEKLTELPSLWSKLLKSDEII